MKCLLKLRMVGHALLVALTFVVISGIAHADNWVGNDVDGTGGDGVSWEDPLNWELDAVPFNNTSDQNVRIGGNEQVVFDADTWAFLQANDDPAADPAERYLQNATEYRIARLLMGDRNGGAFNGSHSLTMDQGDGNTVRATNGTSAVIGTRTNKNTTLNIVSGITNLEGNRIVVGGAVDSSGTINVSGGEMILGRGGLELGLGDGAGTVIITGGAFTTRNTATVGVGGTFDVVGSAASQIGIGSAGANVDGSWTQSGGGVLRSGLDAGGVTPILVDDRDDPVEVGGNVTFESGSVLEPYDAGGANNAWTTVMAWEGTLTDNGLELSAAADSAGWEMRFEGSQLQVRNLSFPDPMLGTVGDFNGDMVVDCADVDEFIGNLDSAAAVRPELDLVVDGVIDSADVAFLVETLVVTSNGEVGTFLGDFNCDGNVNVLGDAFALVAGLGNPATSYVQGDINLDGVINVLGDAFVLVANLGSSNAQ